MKSKNKVDQLTAMKLGINLWQSYNNVNMYGPAHPLAQTAMKGFYEQLKKLLENTSPLILHLQGKNLVCEGWILEKEINNLHFINRLNTSGITSVSFLNSILFSSLVEFLKILNDTLNFDAVSSMVLRLKELDIKNIQLNTHEVPKPSKRSKQSPASSKSRPAMKSEKEIERKTEEVIPQEVWGIKLADLQGDPKDPVKSKLYQQFEKRLLRGVLHSPSKDSEKKEELKKVLDQSKLTLFKQMGKSGVTPLTIQELEGLYQQRLSVLLDTMRGQLLIDSIVGDRPLANKKELKTLAEKIKSDPEKDTLFNSVLYLLGEKNYPKELLDFFIKVTLPSPKSKEKIKEKKKPKISYQLPRGIPTLKETLRFLATEINRNLRYSTPFSCLSISVANLSTEEESRKPEPEELAPVFRKITKLLNKSLRNLDFIGSLGPLKNNHLMVIMIMTEKEGLMKVAMRLVEIID